MFKNLLVASLPPAKHISLNSKALSETHKPFFSFVFQKKVLKKKKKKKKKCLFNLKAGKTFVFAERAERLPLLPADLSEASSSPCHCSLQPFADLKPRQR